MDWLHPGRREHGRAPGRDEPGQTGATRVERSAPGVATLLAPLKDDGSHVILDLGPATPSHLRLYRRFARQIRFAGLLPTPPHGGEWKAVLRGLPPHPTRPYDVVVAWNILDRLEPEERSFLIERLDELTAEGARLYAVVDASEEPAIRPLRFTLLGEDRVSQEPVGPPERARGRLLPAEVERLLEPFEVVRAFTLRLGLREYVAVKRSGVG